MQRTIALLLLTSVVPGCWSGNQRAERVADPVTGRVPQDIEKASIQSIAGDSNSPENSKVLAWKRFSVKGTFHTSADIENPNGWIKITKVMKDGRRVTAGEGMAKFKEIGDKEFAYTVQLKAPLRPGEYMTEFRSLENAGSPDSTQVVVHEQALQVTAE